MISEEPRIIRIKSTHPPSQGEFVEINAEDFDPMVHEEYLADEAAAPAKRGPGRPRKLA